MGAPPLSGANWDRTPGSHTLAREWGYSEMIKRSLCLRKVD